MVLFQGRLHLLGLPSVPCQVPVEEVFDGVQQPSETEVDSSDGYLKVVHFSVVIWRCQIIRAEGAQQQG